MNKPVYTVEQYSNRIRHNSFLRTLRTGVVVTFMLMAVGSYAGPVSGYQFQLPPKSGVVMTLHSTSSDAKTMTEVAFQKKIDQNEMADRLEPVMRFISNGLGDIKVDRVMVDCDSDCTVLNVAYRLQTKVLLSISKPLETMEDDFVMFNVYYNRNLLISDTVSVGLLSEYIHKVEKLILEDS